MIFQHWLKRAGSGRFRIEEVVPYRHSLSALILCACVVSFSGCSGGVDGAPSPAPSPASPSPPPPPPPTGTAAIEVLPATYDFGKVTSSNVPAPLEVTIKNNGNAALQIAEISLLAPSGPPFDLRTGAGSRPCGSATPTIAAADSCTLQIGFAPPSNGAFSATLRIASNDRSSPFNLAIAGRREDIAALQVRINQIDTACPSPETKAYVSVTDQGNFPVLGLGGSNFSLTQNASPLTLASVSPIDTTKPAAIVAVLDHSSSITNLTVAFADMKKGFASLLAGLRAGDVAEIIKFDTELEVVQAFTSNQALLQAVLAAPYDKGTGTRLYDSVFQAIDDAATRTGFRKAVVVATDGDESGISVKTLAQVVENARAKNVPVFAIGIGNQVNRAIMEQLVGGTGGVFYEASNSQNLATVFGQIASLLYTNQYVLTFNQLPRSVAGVTSDVTVGAIASPLSGSAVKPITSCP